MSKSESGPSWRDLIAPTDPRYQSWLLMRAFLQAEENEARAAFLRAYKKNGSVQMADVLRLVQRSFDAAARSIISTVTGTVSAEQRSHDLDELQQGYLERYKRWFPSVESLAAIPAGSLEAKVRLILTIRVAHWKKEAFRLGFESEASRAEESDRAEPGSSSASTDSKPKFPVASWSEVEILLLNDHTVQITAGSAAPANYEYSALGMADKRKGAPRKAWATLQTLAKEKGRLASTAPGHYRAKSQKRIQEVRKWLGELFGVSEDPFSYQSGDGYQAKFRIGRANSYRD